MIVQVIALTLIVIVLYHLGRLALEFFRKTNIAPPKDQCPRCEGEGYWYDLRGRERCNLCGGTGTIGNE